MKKLLLAAALASVAFATAANATVIIFVPYGGLFTPPAVPPGETLVTNFSTAAGLTGTYKLKTGSSGSGSAPAFSSSTFDPHQYLDILRGQKATLAIPKELGVEI